MLDVPPHKNVFRDGRGLSVRNLDLTALPAKEIHARLSATGFRGVRIPIGTAISREGRRRFLCVDGLTTEDALDRRVLTELLYRHADDGIVRVYPGGLPSFGQGMMAPCSRLSIRAPLTDPEADRGLDSEIVALSASGEPLPRSPLPDHGIRTKLDETANRKRAISVLAGTRMPVVRGDDVVLPTSLADTGLSLTRTVMPVGDFASAARGVEQAVAALGLPVLRHESNGRRYLLFAGSPRVSRERYPSFCALASFAIDYGQFSFHIDPIGYSGSVNDLKTFLGATLPRFAHRVYDDTTGAEISAAQLARFPSIPSLPHRQLPSIPTVSSDSLRVL